ncbi:hypothetical protein PQO03_20140 [Lentisphaera profundi]|uniref:Uncharacterized protein n=1 Tax=Lentisphaera profundi TaxID=1658616 RepID=A0ABY7VV82_9BACT|nr:hypothetical protein [Lentisphaera profundi]WDE98133.1 hypothetical protein PQO03_20140 [Lentisphaera profundi]
MRSFFFFVCISFHLVAQVSLLPNGGRVDRAINDSLDVEAIYFDRVAAPYGSSFESWVGGEVFSKGVQSGAGGYKIWSEKGEYLARGEVFYRWPVESFPEQGFLEIFSDDHVVIELLNEGRHLAVGKGKLVFDLSTLPAFYENIILRFSSRRAHRALVWANVYSEFEWVRGGSVVAGVDKQKWQAVDSPGQMKLRNEKSFIYKRLYDCVDSNKLYRLDFPSDIKSIVINGHEMKYPQVLARGFLKEGQNELIYESESWLMGSDTALINFQEMLPDEAALKWLTLDGKPWLYESSLYSGLYSDSGQKLLFKGSKFDSIKLQAELVCSQEDLDKGVNLLFRKKGGAPNSFWSKGKLLVPTLMKVNGRVELIGPEGLKLKNLNLGKNTLEVQLRGQVFKPYIEKGVVKKFEIKPPAHAYQLSFEDEGVRVELASMKTESCVLYVGNKKIFDELIKKGEQAELVVDLAKGSDFEIGMPGLSPEVFVFEKKTAKPLVLDLSNLPDLSELLAYFLACDPADAYTKFNALRKNDDDLTLWTLMPDGVPLGLYLYPYFRDKLIAAKVNQQKVNWRFFQAEESPILKDRFEQRAFSEWLEVMDYELSTAASKQEKVSEFKKSREMYLLDIYQSMKSEFEWGE